MVSENKEQMITFGYLINELQQIRNIAIKMSSTFLLLKNITDEI
jgi:hypothetical protein